MAVTKKSTAKSKSTKRPVKKTVSKTSKKATGKTLYNKDGINIKADSRGNVKISFK